MFVELHMLQNFAPSCLNRDDTNTPKDCVFGGSRRARISSQCIKRSIRQYFAQMDLLPDQLAVRTKRLVDELVKRLVDKGHDAEEAHLAAVNAIQATGLKLKSQKESVTQYLIFLGFNKLDELAALIDECWDTFKAKKFDLGKEDKELKKKIDNFFDGDKASDLALFGRMLADLPGKNIDASCQVAHALSTHKIDMEMDYFTAVDDLNPDDDPGAGMIGTVEFNSACFYRYAVVHMDKLNENLGNDEELTRATLNAFLKASIAAIPSGKQNTFAAHNPPSFIMAVVRPTGSPWSLANAFEKPVWTAGKGLVEDSIKRLDAYWGNLQRMYCGQDISPLWIATEPEMSCEHLGQQNASVQELIEATVAAACGAEVVS